MSLSPHPVSRCGARPLVDIVMGSGSEDLPPPFDFAAGLGNRSEEQAAECGIHEGIGRFERRYWMRDSQSSTGFSIQR